MDHRVLILSKTDREALNILRMAQLALDNLPKWMVDIDKTNSHEIKTKDGSSICSMACEAVCGRNCDHLIIDEPAFISDMERYWYSFYPCVMNKEGKVTVVSTTNGAKGWFYETYMSALREENEFHVIDIPFWESSFFRDKARVREMRLNLTEKGFAQEILGVFL
jgi:phage FluMu gp28-like protein